MVDVDREVPGAQLESGVQRIRNLVRGDHGPGARDGGDHPAPQHFLRLLHLHRLREDDANWTRGISGLHSRWRGAHGRRRGRRRRGVPPRLKRGLLQRAVPSSALRRAFPGDVAGEEAVSAPDLVHAVTDVVARVEAAEAEAGLFLWRGTAARARRGSLSALGAAAPTPAPRSQPGAALVRRLRLHALDAVDLQAGAEAGGGGHALGRGLGGL